MQDDLQPCPFCGATDAHHQSDYGDESQFVCAVCDARGPMKREYAASLDAWNTRAKAGRITALEASLAAARRDALEEAARVAESEDIASEDVPQAIRALMENSNADVD